MTIGLSLAMCVASSAMAGQDRSVHHQPAHSVKSKPAKHDVAATRVAHLQRRHQKQARRSASALPPPDQYIGSVRPVGVRQFGSAAWYGGRHLGKLTASGERLDAVRATAAHRSLPLHSLVRVTNLSNGRSVIVKINDRGPVSRSLVIDVSPRAAKELDMINAGIAKVAIELVAPASSAATTAAR